MNMPSISTIIKIEATYPSKIKVHAESLSLAFLGFILKYPRCQVMDGFSESHGSVGFWLGGEVAIPMIPNMMVTYVEEYHTIDEQRVFKPLPKGKARGDFLIVCSEAYYDINNLAMEELLLKDDGKKWRRQIWTVIK